VCKVNSVLAGVLLALALAGCGGDDDEPGTAGESIPNIVQPGAPGEPSRTLTPEELAEIEPTKYTATDVTFMQRMVPHHAQALRMTALVPARSSRKGIELLARRIEISQETEIGQIRRWLTTRGETMPKVHDGGGHAAGRTLMPGMLTEPELRRLEAARGTAFDRLFLESMIRHHEGALTMVAELYASEGGAESELDFFARHVDADQQIEIGRMRETLAELAKTG
jgi:uncharacterized protein (DUF305 family)